MDHIILFWPQKDTEGLAGWVISPMPGPPPRQHKHERQYTPSTHSVIRTWRTWNDDYDGQMIFGDLGGPKVSWHVSYRWGKTPKKTTPRKPVPTGDRTRARCVASAHATTCSTVVDQNKYKNQKIFNNVIKVYEYWWKENLKTKRILKENRNYLLVMFSMFSAREVCFSTFYSFGIH